MGSFRRFLRNADPVNDLRLRIKLESKLPVDRDVVSGIENLKLTEH